MERRLTVPSSTTTLQRPQRPCPPQGRLSSRPARSMASERREPASTSTVLPEGLKVTRHLLPIIPPQSFYHGLAERSSGPPFITSISVRSALSPPDFNGRRCRPRGSE